MYDIVIIGAGPAGLTAALYALRCSKSVLVLEGETFGGQITLAPAVENYPGTGILSGAEFADTLMRQVTDLGGDIELGHVSEIKDGKVKRIVTEYDEYKAKSVIIAAGARHRTLGIEREEELTGKGVSYCAVCDGAFYKGKDVAVAGGGSSALTDALYLSGICRTVYLIHRREDFRAEKRLIEKIKEKENIKPVLNSEVIKLNGADRLESLEISEGGSKNRSIDVSALFIMIGRTADNEIFKNVAELGTDGYINSGEDCRTKTPGIFAAGDCRKKSIRQLTTAAADGTVAALAACGYIDNYFED